MKSVSMNDRRRRRSRRSLGAAILAMALVAASCGGDDDTADDTPSDVTTAATTADAPAATTADAPADTTAEEPADTTAEEPADTTAEEPAATTAPEEPADEPTQGGEIVVGVLFDSFGFDPTKVVGGVADGTVSLAVFDSLMSYDEEANVVPQLAESLETEDSVTWTMGLRPDVTFSDGTPLDAEAVKFNIERHQDIALLSRSILNARNIESLTVVDPLTLEIKTKFAWPAFPETFIGSLGIVGSPTALAADPVGFNTNPVGAGPFTLSQWIPGDSIVVERNPNYWNAAENEPHLDKITYRLVLDTQTRRESVKAGEIALGQSTNGAEILFADEDGLIGYPVNGPGISVQMNGTAAPFDDVRVRMAALQATDRETIFNVVFEGAGQYPANNFLISNESEFIDPSIEYPEFDPAAATALVEAYEAENGPIQVTFQCHTQPDLVNMTQVVQQMWSAVGIDVEVSIIDQQTLVSNIFQKNYQAACFGSVGQTNPDLAYYGGLYSTSPTNSVGYSNPEVDAALDLGRTSSDFDERFAAYQVVQQALATDVPLFQMVTSPWGWFGNDQLGGMFTLRNASFNSARVYLK